MVKPIRQETVTGCKLLGLLKDLDYWGRIAGETIAGDSDKTIAGDSDNALLGTVAGDSDCFAC